MHAYPPLSGHMAAATRRLVAAVQIVLYASLLAMPLIGWAALDVAGATIPVFGVATLSGVFAKDEDRSDLMFAIDGWFAIALPALVALNVAGGLRHRFVLKDEVMDRMMCKNWRGQFSSGRPVRSLEWRRIGVNPMRLPAGLFPAFTGSSPLLAESTEDSEAPARHRSGGSPRFPPAFRARDPGPRHLVRRMKTRASTSIMRADRDRSIWDRLRYSMG